MKCKNLSILIYFSSILNDFVNCSISYFCCCLYFVIICIVGPHQPMATAFLTYSSNKVCMYVCIQLFRQRLSNRKSVRDNTERHDGLWLFTVASSVHEVFSALEGGAMNTCLRVLKETKWILSF